MADNAPVDVPKDAAVPHSAKAPRQAKAEKPLVAKKPRAPKPVHADSSAPPPADASSKPASDAKKRTRDDKESKPRPSLPKRDAAERKPGPAGEGKTTATREGRPDMSERRPFMSRYEREHAHHQHQDAVMTVNVLLAIFIPLEELNKAHNEAQRWSRVRAPHSSPELEVDLRIDEEYLSKVSVKGLLHVVCVRSDLHLSFSLVLCRTAVLPGTPLS